MYAVSVIDERAIPLLKAVRAKYELHTTSGPKDAGRLGQKLLSDAPSPAKEPLTVIVAGGDGTAHELIEGVLDGQMDGQRGCGRWELVILPCGTVRVLSEVARIADSADGC